MKKIQKLLSAFLFISASLSAAVPTQYNLDLNKNNGVEITNFIKKYITPQRPNPKNFGMLQLNFDRDDIQIGSQLKQAIESKKVVVARRKKAAWRKQLEDHYGYFINLDVIKTTSDLMALESAFTKLNNYMNRPVAIDTYIKNLTKSAQTFMNYYNAFIAAGGQEEPFKKLVATASLTIKRSPAKDTATIPADLLAEIRAKNAKAEEERKEFAAAYADKLDRLIKLINKDEEDMTAEEYAEMEDLSKGIEDGTETIENVITTTGMVTAEGIKDLIGDDPAPVFVAGPTLGALSRVLPKIDLSKADIESVIENIFNKAKQPKMLPAGSGIKALPAGFRPKPLPAPKPKFMLAAPAQKYQLKSTSGVTLYKNDIEKAEKARQLSRKNGLNFATKALRILKKMPK